MLLLAVITKREVIDRILTHAHPKDLLLVEAKAKLRDVPVREYRWTRAGLLTG